MTEVRQQPIAFIDSGIGGLSILKEVVALLPAEQVVYVADQKFFPYSTQDPAAIRTRVTAIASLLVKQGVKMLVLACNTATVTAIAYLRSQFDLPIVGVVPVIKTAVKLTKSGIVAVIATKVTINSGYHADLVQRFATGVRVINLPCTGLIELVESQSAPDLAVIRHELLPLQGAGVDVLALGCTHYPLIKAEIAIAMGPGTLVLDSGEAVACQIKRVLTNNGDLRRAGSYKWAGVACAQYLYLATAKPERLQQAVARYLGLAAPEVLGLDL